MPFGIAINIFRNEHDVPFGHVDFFIQIDVGSAPFYDHADSGFPAAAVSAAEMIIIKYML